MAHQKGDFITMDATPTDVVNHYGTQFKLNLSNQNLFEYLKGI
jgi:hypothetical protein